MQDQKDKRKTLFAERFSALLQVLLLLSLSCFYSTTCSGQISASSVLHTVMIKGSVEDSLNKVALSRVTITVHDVDKIQVGNSSYTTENGSFKIAVLPQRQYLLEISHVGYHPKTIKFYSPLTATTDLSSIALVPLPNSLKEIKIIAVKPLIEQDADKLIYNVEADPDSRSASAIDILRKIPHLSTDAEDNLQLNGNDNYRILINGKSSSLFLRSQSDLFKNLSASSIKAIEVMTIPPSRYEAQGVGGIINIITYKKNIGGYSGGINVQGSYPQGLYTNGHFTASLGKFSISGNAGYNTSITPATNSTSLRQNKIDKSRLEQLGTGNSNYALLNTGNEISYELNSYNLLTVGYSRNKGSNENTFIQKATLLNAFGLPANVNRYSNIGNGKQAGDDFSIDYLHTFRKNEAQQFTLSYKASNSTSESMANFLLQPGANFKSRTTTTKNDDGLKEQTLQADYVQPINKHTLELGVRSIERKNSSDFFYQRQDTTTGALVLDSSQSNVFYYREHLNAAYTSLNLKLNYWGLRLGARLEQAKIEAHFVSSDTFARQQYVNLMPTFTLSRRLKGVSMMKLSYAQRIHRPTLDYLNPYIDLSDPWNISYGNPGLQPALAHVFDLAYNTSIKKTFLNLAVFHQFTNNSIQQFTMLGADTVARTTFGNVGKNRSYSFSMSINTSISKNLNLNLNSNVTYLQYTRLISNKPYKNGGLTYSILGSVYFRTKSWRVSSNAGYHAPNVLLQGKSAGYFSNSISLSKHFLKNQKASIGLQVNSPFQEIRRTYTEVNDPAFYQFRESYSIIRKFTLSFNYRFGKIQGGTQKK